ncbi:hypothetical protein PRZ48_012497 [Zasmidium cellare]|uniref:DJ-1/PfpI domain-containing protein n=1 Tax=Zasmidium cellare TaxID=395010 RepID=A0ABR0E510_ZASCE|nr:hypothetical protein PRZ48_012497 [Zasmidium cellare]
MSGDKPYSIAVFHEAVQFSDLLPVDVIGNLSVAYIDAAIANFPDVPFLHQLREQALDLTVHWVASTLEPSKITPGVNMSIQPTHTYETCPLDVDMLFIAGPHPSSRPPGSLEYIRKFVAAKKGILMTTCTGSLWAASAGVFKGRKVTTNRGALEAAGQFHPEAEWVDKRWVIDEKPGETRLWTSGGAYAGADMASVFARREFPKEIVEFALNSLDLSAEKHGEDY